MKKYVLIYNPVAGHAVFCAKLDFMIETFQKRNAIIIPYRTKQNNHELVEVLQVTQPEGILVAGGDGTLHEVVNILLKNGIDLPIAIIPSGTSNDFASFLGITEDLEEYFDRIINGNLRAIDVGKVGKEYFINVASAGMFTSIAHEVDARLKNAIGKMAYYVSGFAQMPRVRSINLTVIADGTCYKEEAILFVVVNSDIVGSMRHVAEFAKVDDGVLDLLLVRKCSLKTLMSITTDLFAGKPVSKREEILYLQAKHFEITSDTEVESDFDGEKGPMLPLVIDTISKAIKVFS